MPHPHVIGAHDLVESEDRLWIIMQLLDALEAVHAVGTLHRDVEPANVLLRRDGSAALTDFGIAALDDGDFLTGNPRHGVRRTVPVPQAGESRDPARGGVRGAGPDGAARPAAPGRRGTAQVPAGAPVGGRRAFRAPARRGGPLADADTVTRGRPGTVGHEEAPTPTAGTTPAAPSGGRRLLGWAAVAAAAVGGLFLTGVLPLQEDPKTTTVSQVVQSGTGRQAVSGLTVQRGDQVTVRFVAGKWTADHRNMPMTGPAGYDRSSPRRRSEPCRRSSRASRTLLTVRVRVTHGG
ncbi:hypothetical protein ABZ464_21160 [Streptomyces sp. NPDC005820]|uniref:protein kinase domain-containing protein n=1 Tax=Streptomyces sp. NPDC005820 TaxID=3157069 RepID=UPI0033D12B3A